MVPVQYGNLTQLLMMPTELNSVVGIIKTLPENALMVEWGSGGSTCKWLETLSPTQRLITVEHNTEWFINVRNTVNDYFGNVDHRFEFYHVPEEPGYIHGYGQIEEENPYGLSKYICPSPEIYTADLYFVDGIARGACVAAILINRQKKNSRVLIHDYTPRTSAYNWISQFCNITQLGETLVELSI